MPAIFQFMINTVNREIFLLSKSCHLLDSFPQKKSFDGFQMSLG